MAKVHTIMSECIFRMNESDTVAKAVAIMREQNIQHLPVFLDKSLTGMVSTFDLVGCTPDQLISEIMSKPLQITREDGDLKDVIVTLLEKKIHALPVLNNNDQLVGIVSSTDVLKHYNKISEML